MDCSKLSGYRLASSQIIGIRQHDGVVGKLLGFQLAFLEIACSVELVMELGNLVRMLTNSRDLDGTRPVGVHECLAEGQVLDVLFRDISMRLVELHVEVSWSDTANGGLLRDHEEVIAVVVEVLNQLLVDDGTWWWVDNLSTSILTEHSLVDPLVHDDQSDLWWVHLVVLLKKE